MHESDHGRETQLYSYWRVCVREIPRPGRWSWDRVLQIDDQPRADARRRWRDAPTTTPVEMPVVAVMDDPRRLVVLVVPHDGASRGRAVLDDVMPWRGLRSPSSATVRPCEGRSAEGDAGNCCDHHCFQDLVHSAPSLSSFGLTRTFLAAYIWVGEGDFDF